MNILKDFSCRRLVFESPNKDFQPVKLISSERLNTPADLNTWDTGKYYYIVVVDRNNTVDLLNALQCNIEYLQECVYIRGIIPQSIKGLLLIMGIQIT